MFSSHVASVREVPDCFFGFDGTAIFEEYRPSVLLTVP